MITRITISQKIDIIEELDNMHGRNKVSNKKRNTKGSSKGKKGVTPYKYYYDMGKILGERNKIGLNDENIKGGGICKKT